MNTHSLSMAAAAPLTAMALWLLASLLPGVGLAAASGCDERKLKSDDERRLLAAARTALPVGVEPFVAHPCRNAQGASASIITTHLKSHGGLVHWWEFDCRRETGSWSCATPQLKQFVATRLTVLGERRSVALSFDADLPLDRAEQLSTQAMALYTNPDAHVPRCGGGGGFDSTAGVFHRGHPLPSGAKPIQVLVNRTREGQAVWLEDVPVEIEFSGNDRDTADLRGVCWNEIELRR